MDLKQADEQLEEIRTQANETLEILNVLTNSCIQHELYANQIILKFAQSKIEILSDLVDDISNKTIREIYNLPQKISDDYCIIKILLIF